MISELHTEIKFSFKNFKIITLLGSEGYRATKEKQHRNQRNEKPNLHTRGDRTTGTIVQATLIIVTRTSLGKTTKELNDEAGAVTNFNSSHENSQTL